MKQSLNVVWTNAVFLTMSISVCGHPQVGVSSQMKIADVDRSALQSTTSDIKLTAQAKKPATRAVIFVFHTDEFWLNLHHFLYVLGRAENKERDTSREAVAGAPGDQQRGLEKLSPKEQTIWREAVASYAAGFSKKDLVFDDPLPAVTNALARAGDSSSLTAPEVGSAVTAALQRAAPIYRKAWWKEHLDSNRNWKKNIQVLIDRDGPAVLAFITSKYMLQWPSAGFPVHVSAYSNWAGAYSTSGNLLVIASHSSGNQAMYGLESIFHEAMHQWDDQIFEALTEQAKKVNQTAPRRLSHGLIFFTAGEAVRQVAPEHVPYAEKFGVWERGWGSMKVVLEEVWKPYLDGRGTRDEAFAELIKRTAVASSQK
jgi:hypothetical protein